MRFKNHKCFITTDTYSIAGQSLHLIELYVWNSTLKQRSDLLRNDVIETWLQNLNIFQHLVTAISIRDSSRKQTLSNINREKASSYIYNEEHN